jgi:type II restriction enzyme
MERNFKEWLAQFKFSISDYSYYVDFDKVVTNVKAKKIELNILNSLIGSKNIEQDFENIINRYPETLSCIPLLLAVRQYEIFAKDKNGEFLYDFQKMNYSIEQYKYFMRKTKLFEMLSNHLVNNLIDYALGVETGLDSNGRKNRGGHLMENLVESFIKKAGFQRDINYFKEMQAEDVMSKWDVNLNALTNNGKTVKRFDFVVKTDNMVYAIETNFYGGKGGGSKLNETARSYKMISEEARSIPNFEFVWITDGTAWNSAKNNLEETFDVHPYMYNIKELEDGIMKKIFI